MRMLRGVVVDQTWVGGVRQKRFEWLDTTKKTSDKGAWKLAIYVAEPWVSFEILYVLTLAYSNLLGNEDITMYLSQQYEINTFLVSG